MQIAFSRSVPYVPEFNKNKALPEDKQIKTLLVALEFGELISVTDALQRAGLDKVDTTRLAEIDLAKMKAVIEMAGELIPAHVKSLEGLNDSDGPVKTTDLLSYSPYIELGFELLVKLVNISSPSETDAKN